MSQSEFLEAVEMYGLNEFGDVMDALWALKDRGELEHLIALVWTWK